MEYNVEPVSDEIYTFRLQSDVRDIVLDNGLMCLEVDHHDIALSWRSTGGDIEIAASSDSPLSYADIVDCKRVENICFREVDISFGIAVGERRKTEFSYPSAAEPLTTVCIYESIGPL